MISSKRLGLLTVLSLVILAGCDSVDVSENEADLLGTDQDQVSLLEKHGQSDHLSAGVVYTMTNAADGNEILAYRRTANGRLAAQHSVSTGGLGTGDGLNGTSNPLVLTNDNRYLFAVNGGSNNLSVFRRLGSNLRHTATVSSYGERPVSVTTHGDVVYVLNVGGTTPGNITGYRMRNGRLRHLVTRPVNPGGADLPQIEFTPDGRFLVITDKATNTITTYVVDQRGIAGAPNTTASSGETPFGFDIRADNVLFVSEAFGGATDASAASTYRIRRDGSLEVISPVVLTTETAACWAEITADGEFGYVTNTGSSSVTGYSINRSGELSLLDADGETGHTGAGSSPVDLAIIGNSLMYVHSKGTNEIRGFAINRRDGSLSPVDGAIVGVPATTVGVAAF